MSTLDVYVAQRGGALGLSPVMTHSMIVFATFTLTIVGIAIPATREFALWVLRENNPVEIATFILLLAGAALALRFAESIRRNGHSLLYTAFYIAFAAGLFLTAMEEVAWGQQFFGWSTPEGLREMNMQGETTIHNIKGLHGNTEMMRLLFGFGGLVAIGIDHFTGNRFLGAKVVLLPWFAAITLHSVIDVTNDFVALQKQFDALISKLAELNELMISIAAILYINFNVRWLKGED